HPGHDPDLGRPGVDRGYPVGRGAGAGIMTIALMTDIHANREAFEACLAHAGDHGVDQFVFLGDFVGYGADPEWVLDTLIDLVGRGATALMGNHDAAAIGALSTHLNPSARQCIDWTRPR